MTIPPTTKAQSGESAEWLARLFVANRYPSVDWEVIHPEIRGDCLRFAERVLSAIRERMLGEKAVEAAMDALIAADIRMNSCMDHDAAEGLARAAIAAAVGVGLGDTR